MVDVGVKGISRMKFDCSPDGNEFLWVLPPFLRVFRALQRKISMSYAPRPPTLSPLTAPSSTTRLRRWLSGDSRSVSANLIPPRCPFCSSCPRRITKLLAPLLPPAFAKRRFFQSRLNSFITHHQLPVIRQSALIQNCLRRVYLL